MLERVTVVGTGLIGASLARALRTARFARQVVGVDANAHAARVALELGHLDAVLPLERAVEGAELIVVAVPVGATGSVLAALAGLGSALAEHAVITDTGSAKGAVVVAARAALGAGMARFVPGHPIAGLERDGPAAADGRLFEGRTVVLTPLPETATGALEQVRAAWRAAGATVLELDVERHDRALAAVSHLPHLIAYALVQHVVAHDDAALALALAAGGFRDVTRIAASSPTLWRDIALANRTHLLGAIDAYEGALRRLRALVETGDAPGLEAAFEGASAVRRSWPKP